jgi:acyl-coenzyme A synthetase/AMP-(fatty) acid ligase/acyl carrier protein
LSEYIELGPEDSFAYYFSIGFSAHALPSLGALLNGGTLFMYNLPRDGFPGLADFFNEENITNCLMIPSVLRHFRSTLQEGYKFKKLRSMLIGGETLYYNDIRQIKPFLRARTEIINIYASTELYLTCAYRINRDAILNQNIIPIGTPVNGMEIEIHNEDGAICEHNQVGEMIIYSDYAACGYWNNEELSAKDFPPGEGKSKFNSRDLAYQLPDGKLVHVGRKDAMVKIRGQRVDLGEIENSLLFSVNIREVAAVMKEDPLGNKTLIAYYVCASGKQVVKDELRKSLINRLPDYMMPQFLLELEEFPKTASGKTDYLNLPDPDWERSAGKKDIKHATNPIEEKLTSLFEKHLEIYPIDISENILQAGNDSLKLFVAFDSIEKTFKIKIDLDDFLKDPTIRSLAEIIKKSEENDRNAE